MAAHGVAAAHFRVDWGEGVNVRRIHRLEDYSTLFFFLSGG